MQMQMLIYVRVYLHLCAHVLMYAPARVSTCTLYVCCFGWMYHVGDVYLMRCAGVYVHVHVQI